MIKPSYLICAAIALPTAARAQTAPADPPAPAEPAAPPAAEPVAPVAAEPPPAPAPTAAPAGLTVEVAPVEQRRERREHNFYIRAGAALVAPISSSNETELSDVSGPASLSVRNGPIAGSGSKVNSALIPAGVLGYVLPTQSRRWSIETVLGLPFTVKFENTGTLRDMSIAPTAAGLPTGVAALGPELGEAKALPPVLTVVYQLLDHGPVLPYVGAGGSVLFSYDAKVTNRMLTEVNQPELTISSAVPGVVVQGGAEVRIIPQVWARIDVKFIALMKVDAELKHVNVKLPNLPLFESVEVGTAKASVWVNPLIVQAGVGIDFW